MDLQNLDIKKTINLPRTDFPMKANLPRTEPKILARWEEEKLYEKIRAARAGQQAIGPHSPDHRRRPGQ